MLTLVRFLGAFGATKNKIKPKAVCLVQQLVPRSGGERADRHALTQLAEYTMEPRMFAIPATEIVRMEQVSLQGEGSYQHSRGVWHIGAGRHLKPCTHPNYPATKPQAFIDSVVVRDFPSK